MSSSLNKDTKYEPPLKKAKTAATATTDNNKKNRHFGEKKRVDQLFHWLKNNDVAKGFIDLDSIEMSYTEKLGCHLRAVRDLNAGETLFSVPADLMITWKTLLNSNIAKYIYHQYRNNNNNLTLLDNHFSYYDKLYKIEIDRLSSLSGEQLLRVHMEKNLDQRIKILNSYAPEKHVERPNLLSDHGLLMAYLIKARFSTATGKIFHGAYAKSLPDIYTTPLTWNCKQISLLANCILGHTLLRSMAAHMNILLYDYHYLMKHDNETNSVFTLENMVWASQAIRSRNFGEINKMTGNNSNSNYNAYKDKRTDNTKNHEQNVGVLVPVLDLINHDPGTVNVTWETEKHNNEIPSCVLYHQVKAGYQIMSHYGNEQSNFDLIELHGFAQFDGACDVLKIGWSVADVSRSNPLHNNANNNLSVLLNNIFKESNKNFKHDSIIEFELSHDAPVPKHLVSIANAIAADQIANQPNTATTLDILAKVYLLDYLNDKIKKLFIHLEHVVGKYFNHAIWDDKFSNKLQQIEYASMQWEQLIAKNLQQGNVVSLGLSDDTRTIYAISPETQILAYFDSQVNIVHHAIDNVRSGEIPEAQIFSYIK
jgi:hypothetical protein